MSPEIAARRLLISTKNDKPREQMGPSVSIATGTKMCVLVIDAYFKVLRSAAASAAPPILVAVTEKSEDANVSTTVASHVKHLPACQGTRVRPSGRFPSPRNNPVGSLVEGLSA